MKRVFVDTSFWIALANPHDQWHSRAQQAKQRLGPCTLVTTDEVLVEFLNGISKRGGPQIRDRASRTVEALQSDQNVRVIPQSRDSFMKGLSLFKSRLDKTYSLVDCISFVTMQEESLREFLTSDSHFLSAGFLVLIAR